jgi:hypothetical protein
LLFEKFSHCRVNYHIFEPAQAVGENNIIVSPVRNLKYIVLLIWDRLAAGADFFKFTHRLSRGVINIFFHFQIQKVFSYLPSELPKVA